MSSEFLTAAVPVTQNQNQNNTNSTAFATALQRAKKVAAKIQSPGSSNPLAAPVNNTESLKRTNEDSGDQPDTKKLAGTAAINNSIESVTVNSGANSANISTNGTSDSSSSQTAAAQAAAVVARVAAAAAAGIQGVGSPGLLLGPVTNKDIKVPDKMVGLIIGRGGEQISRLQAESGCKIQMAPDSGGMPDRVCTLTGNSQSISRAEELISQIIHSRAREVYPAPGSSSSMSPVSNSGMSRMNEIPKQNMLSNQSTGFTQVEIMIPGPKVGLIIGKGGETIKQLQEKSGAKMIIIQEGPNQQEQEKPLRISGDVARVEHAKALVHELLAEKDQIMRRGRGPGNPNGVGYNPAMSSTGGRPWDPEQVETTINVPAGKCGVIIGKGGETIRLINQQTGAFCEIDRKQAPNAPEKTFIIRGTHEQIEHAKRLFQDKLNMALNTGPVNGPPMNGPSYGHGGPQGGGPGGPHNYPGNQWMGAQQYQQQQQWHSSQQAQGQQPHAGAAGASATAGSVQINPVTGQPDYSAQWIEYYRSLGMHREAALVEEQAKANKLISSGQQSVQSQQMGMQAQMQAQQLQMQQAAAVQGQQMGMASQGATQQPAMTAVTQQQQQQQSDGSNQPDYSAQWAVYYRSIGKIKEAEAIESQMKAKGMTIPAAQAQPAVASNTAATAGAAVQSMYGQQQQQQAAAAAMYAYQQQQQAANPAAANTAATGFYGASAPQQQAAVAAATSQQYAYPNYATNYGQQQPASVSSESHPPQ